MLQPLKRSPYYQHRSNNPGQHHQYSRLNGAPATNIEQLTEREREILALVARSASNRQVAENLYLTEGTVKNYMSNILSKPGVRDRTQAALRAKELGL